MNIAIILSGGTGTRFGGTVPKQYIEVEGKPVLAYTLEAMEHSPQIDGIVVVCAPMWEDTVLSIAKKYRIQKFLTTAPAGENRQRSCFAGLLAVEARGGCQNVVIHDAVRPLVNDGVIARGLEKLGEYDAALSVVTCKDTTYISTDGQTVTALIDRSTLFAGQTPEYFRFDKYLAAMRTSTDDEIDRATGSAVIAFRYGLTVALAEGDEHNFKLTTAADMTRFRMELQK